jgi:ABC-2 type transport system permease protein
VTPASRPPGAAPGRRPGRTTGSRGNRRTLPFAAFGILVGYLLDADTAQPVTVVTSMALAVLGGLWMPTATMPAAMRQLAHLLPSYHLADLGWRAVAGQPPIAGDGLVLLAWTLVFAGLAAWRYRRAEARA